MRLEKIFLLTNVAITLISIILLVLRERFQGSDKSAQDLDKPILISYLVTCAILLCLNSYMIYHFLKMGLFYLSKLNVNKSMTRLNYVVVLLLIFLVIVQIFKDYVFEVFIQCLITFNGGFNNN